MPPTTSRIVLVTLVLGFVPGTAHARQEAPASSQAPERRGWSAVKFLAGAAAGLGIHESGHLIVGAILDADPGVSKISFGPIPFFAITHRSSLSSRGEYAVSSAGFWFQYASSEVVLTRHPNLRYEHAPFAKGLLAFDVLTSVVYAGAAFARAGPPERDTRSMAWSLGTPEPWVGALILGPAVLDAIRYYRGDPGWAKWSSRGIKVSLVLLTLVATGADTRSR